MYLRLSSSGPKFMFHETSDNNHKEYMPMSPKSNTTSRFPPCELSFTWTQLILWSSLCNKAWAPQFPSEPRSIPKKIIGQRRQFIQIGNLKSGLKNIKPNNRVETRIWTSRASHHFRAATLYILVGRQEMLLFRPRLSQARCFARDSGSVRPLSFKRRLTPVGG